MLITCKNESDLFVDLYQSHCDWNTIIYVVRAQIKHLCRYIYLVIKTSKVINMELIRNPKCYTDVCIDGTWYHYDHCGSTVYSLAGGHTRNGFKLGANH